ncbi:hypothetical protein QE152_g40830 [Popillia japonica]|uniref:Uncharacterized protein n=1 Tax=Popillia japonica TaxID=7064 RepID=A0AAW1HF55_POPJA
MSQQIRETNDSMMMTFARSNQQQYFYAHIRRVPKINIWYQTKLIFYLTDIIAINYAKYQTTQLDSNPFSRLFILAGYGGQELAQRKGRLNYILLYLPSFILVYT